MIFHVKREEEEDTMIFHVKRRGGRGRSNDIPCQERERQIK
jgi:hypothetical protein